MAIKRAEIKKGLVYGVGVNDVDFPVTFKGDDGKRHSLPSYSRWRAMLERCYRTRPIHGTYLNITVCKEWLSFSNYHQWWEEQEKLGYINENSEVDKDLSMQGEYSPENCCIIPRALNSALRDAVGKVNCITYKGKRGTKYRASFYINGKQYQSKPIKCRKLAGQTQQKIVRGMIRINFIEGRVERLNPVALVKLENFLKSTESMVA